MKKVLIVEDDVYISDMLKEWLEQNNYHITQAYSGTEALLSLEKDTYSVILLDLMLPGINGMEVLKKIRSCCNVAVIVVSAVDSITDKVDLLRNGADDYITKPFNNEELLVRIETVLRRQQSEDSNSIGYKGLIIHKIKHEVMLDNHLVSLTKNEYNILELLMEHPSRLFTKNNIYELVWGDEYIVEDNVINVHISNIRKKLAMINPNEEYIQTVWGIGFKMYS